MTARKIIHIDMDAFYASVEQRDNPSLRGRPVVVGGSPDGRGVVAAASYEARTFGIRSAQPAARARRLCPDAIFLRPRFDHYRAISRQIHGIFADFATTIEPLSLDEAYLDVTGSQRFHGSATHMAQAIRRRIREETGLTASAGVSYNKLLAKLASDEGKPDGLYVVPPEQGPAYVTAQPIRRLHGVGPATAARLERLGITRVGDLLDWELADLHVFLGNRAGTLHDAARGIDHRPVRRRRPRKSIGAERTFGDDTRDPEEIRERLAPLIAKVATRLESQGVVARTVTLKLRYADFESITRRVSPHGPVAGAADIEALIPALLAETEAGSRAVRLLGVSLSGLQPRQREQDLFSDLT
ncbi:MAG: DNA polymerase IV [Halorhodospira halophila]|uniref:DNA polymerase IV n=1 Tax=Halorhodospira TaxID=85108 RepID=UPI0019118A42|nr:MULTISPECIES: DNA polymerase IV [Halorhodospira]MBK5937280.1 DNA polymerase IV [Halorhodospira halophila]MCC3749781.1 DNA polymerase IV [Halorhodospira halophila]MCG5527697.1 DNA polymerase IV [Halorhodospira halophila]MCG5537739.1 DNA polymerase IV [Halorhodospira sp. 9622]MCG5539912.1 DNA polymerase IV [Halorhodospira sp. M39old]